MTDSHRALTPYIAPPAILSAHAKRGVTSIQLQYHREAMERRRRALARLETNPVEAIAAEMAPVVPDERSRLELALRRYKAKNAKLTALYAEARNANGQTRRPSPTINDIQRLVAARYDVTVTDLLSERRDRTVARPRQIAMYLAKVVTLHSLHEIGRRFGRYGGRDHSTAFHAIAKIETLRAGSESFCAEVDGLERFLMGESTSLPMKQSAPDPAHKRRGGAGVSAKVLTAMRDGASTAAAVARALDISILSVTGGISRLLRTGEIVQVDRKGKGKRAFNVYAVSGSDA